MSSCRALSPGPRPRQRHRGWRGTAAASAACLALWPTPGCSSSSSVGSAFSELGLAETGFRSQYYQSFEYKGSRVLEHNETGHFLSYIEVTWSQSVAIDPSDNIWVADKTFHHIVRMAPASRYVPYVADYTGYAGVRGYAGHQDGSRQKAFFDGPMGIAVAVVAGRGVVLFVADTNNHVIRRIDIVSERTATIAGKPRVPGLRDGPGPEARFRSPMSIGTDHGGQNIFILDNARRVRHIDYSGSTTFVTTLVDGACRAVRRWTIAATGVLRTVGCHPDWRASFEGDVEVEVFTAGLYCRGHNATCGSRGHPGLSDRASAYLRAPPDLSAEPAPAPRTPAPSQLVSGSA